MGAAVGGLLVKGFTALGMGATAAGIAANLTGALLFSGISRALAPRQSKPSADDVARELAYPNALPPKRFVYGRARVQGSPAPGWFVDYDRKLLYQCLILNSRPSAGGVWGTDDIQIWIDGRKVNPTGDIYDFNGAGGSSADSPHFEHLNMWLGLGDQSGPPYVIGQEWGTSTGGAADKFWPTDAWARQTVLWVRTRLGKPEERGNRWPSSPPKIEVVMNWSKVWDPRNLAQDRDDPATWAWSENQALCLLDAVRLNPVSKYTLSDAAIASFVTGADIADQLLYTGTGVELRRYRVSYLMAFQDGVEIADILAPLVDAGAGDLAQVGGSVHYIPGAYFAPVATFDDVLTDEPLVYVKFDRANSLPVAVRPIYPAPLSSGEKHSLDPIIVPGQVWDGGDGRIDGFDLPAVPHSAQAQRLATIRARRLGNQERLTAVFPARAINLRLGARVTLDFPGPDPRNGVWMVTGRDGQRWQEREDGAVAFSVRLELRRDDPAFWVDAVAELDEPAPVFGVTEVTVAAPGAITAELVVNDTGAQVVQEIHLSAAESTSASVTSYRWEYQIDGGGWQAGGVIPAGSVTGGVVQWVISPAVALAVYDVRLIAVGAGESAPSVVTGISTDLTVTVTAQAGGPGRAEFDLTAPDVAYLAGVRVLRGTTAEIADAVDVSGLIAVARGASVSVVAGDADAVNAVVNGGFNDATGWTVPTGWTIAGGKALVDNAGSNVVLSRAATLTAGGTYRWTVTVSDYVDGGGFVRLIGATNASGPTITAAGLHQGVLVAPSSPTAVGYLAGSATTYAIDDFAVVLETPDCLPQGAANFWIVPETQTGTAGAASGPFLLTVL